MGKETKRAAPLTDALRRAIVESGLSHRALSIASGVERASIHRFMDGTRSLRLDKADRLAAYFGLELSVRKTRRCGPGSDRN